MNSVPSLKHVDPKWALWIMENVILGVNPEDIYQALSDNGLKDAVTLPTLKEFCSRPEFAARKWRETPSDKFERSLLSRYRLRCLRSDDAIQRVSTLHSKEFFETYYCRNEPVILTDLAKHWSLMSDWTPQYLSSRYGDCDVEVQTGRNSDDHYEVNIASHRTRMSLRNYVGLVESVSSSNDVYMCANNRALDCNLAGLFNDIPGLDGYLDSQHAKGRTFLWFGPGGTITPLHYDLMNVLFVQIYGDKEFVLAPPEALLYMYNNTGVFSDVDYKNPDLDRFPLFRNVRFISGTLKAGETLFIPVRWWHFVQTHRVSISLSFTNFVWPNDAEEP